MRLLTFRSISVITSPPPPNSMLKNNLAFVSFVQHCLWGGGRGQRLSSLNYFLREVVVSRPEGEVALIMPLTFFHHSLGLVCLRWLTLQAYSSWCDIFSSFYLLYYERHSWRLACIRSPFVTIYRYTIYLLLLNIIWHIARAVGNIRIHITQGKLVLDGKLV
jgi:hypothetical protein